MDERHYLVDDSLGERLDVWLAKHIDDLSRSRIQKLIEGGSVLVNGLPVRSQHKLQDGDNVEMIVPVPEPTDILAQNIPLDIVFEDAHLIVVNKPRGMVVHPAPGSPDGTLVNAVLAHTEDLSAVGGVERPGIVHRLDKDTSGLMVVAKSDQAHHSLQKQIQDRSAVRLYQALVYGETSFESAVVDAAIGRHPTDRQKMAIIRDPKLKSRHAETEFRVLERFHRFTLLEAKLATGRTHQVRVHASFTGHPVVGDPLYAGKKRTLPSDLPQSKLIELRRLIESLNGQALHAYRLSFTHPVTNERLEFEAPMPFEMLALVDWLREWMNPDARQ